MEVVVKLSKIDENKKANIISREAGLFNALKIEDDVVQLSVVKCLFVIPLQQFDEDEVEQITDVM